MNGCSRWMSSGTAHSDLVTKARTSVSIELSTRLWGINTEFVGFIPQSLVLKSIVWDWILIYRNWSIIRRTESKESINFTYPIQPFQLKKVYILPFFVDFWQQYADKLHLLSVLSLGVVNRINALETMQGIHVLIWGSSFLTMKVFIELIFVLQFFHILSFSFHDWPVNYM